MNGIERKLNPGNVVDAGRRTRAAVRAVKSRDIVAESLEEISDDLGTQRAGAFIAGEGDPEAGTLVGTAMMWPPLEVTLGGEVYQFTLLGMSGGGQVEFGLSAVDGKALAGGGTITLGRDGIRVRGVTVPYEHEAEAGGVTRRGRLRMFLPGRGTGVPAWGLDYDDVIYSQAVQGPSYLNRTYWTNLYDGSRAFLVSGPNGEEATSWNAVYTIPANTNDFGVLGFKTDPYYVGATLSAVIRWIDVGNATIREDIIGTAAASSASLAAQNFYYPMSVKPSNAAKLQVGLRVSANGYTMVFARDISLITAAVNTRRAGFEPVFTLTNTALEMQDLTVVDTPPSGYHSIYAKANGLYIRNSAGIETAIVADFSAVNPQIVGQNYDMSAGLVASMTVPMTIPAGNNRMMLVAVCQSRSSALSTINTATYAGAAMTLIGSWANVYVRLTLYYVVAPPVGTANVVVGAPATNYMSVWAVAMVNVNQSAPVGRVFVKNDESGTTYERVVNSAERALMIDHLLMYGSSGATFGPQQVEFGGVAGVNHTLQRTQHDMSRCAAGALHTMDIAPACRYVWVGLPVQAV